MTAVPKPVRKPRKKRVVVSMKERDIQANAEELCELLNVRFFRIPDKLLGFLKSYAPVWVRVFVARYFAGVPDLMLFRPLPDKRNEVLFLEIKTEAGELSLNQQRWHNGLNVIVAHGWDETEEIIRGFSHGIRYGIH